MTTVAEMIEWLKTQPQDAKVMMLKHSMRGTGYYDQGGNCSHEDFDHKSGYSYGSDPEYFVPDHWDLDGNAEDGYTLLIGEVE